MSASSRRVIPLPANWPQLRAQCLARDGYRCRRCGSRDRLECDHAGSDDDHSPDNLQTLCHKCHARKTALSANAARWGNRDKLKTRPAGKHPGLIERGNGDGP